MPLDLAALIGEPPSPWRVIAERKIQEWVESGGPDQLTNLGQPLDLSDDNPFVPSEMRMAYRVLKNAGMAPDWIEIGKDVEAQPARCREATRLHHHDQRNDRLALRGASAGELPTIRERMKERAARFADEQRARLRHVNALIERFNNACPVSGLHRRRVDVEADVRRALDGVADAA